MRSLAEWMAWRLRTHPWERSILRMWLVEEAPPWLIDEALGLKRGEAERVRKMYRRRASTVDLRRAALLLHRMGLL